MKRKTAKAEVPGFRQESQFTCMAAALAACLKAHGKDQGEADVNRVMGASAMRGATWEDLTAAAQYFGLRSTLVIPSTVNQLKTWTDAGTPVVIAYNPEGRPWSHASVVFDVTGEGADTKVHIMDPNIPDPDETVRVMPKSDFYKVWGEPLGDKMIVRRPACAIEREVTAEGKQVMASQRRVASRAAAVVRDTSGRAWHPKRGLEGPFRFKSGIVLYYDPREGRYYDPSTDMYIDNEVFFNVTGEVSRLATSAIRVAARYAAWRGPYSSRPSMDEMERAGDKALAGHRDREIMEKQEAELQEYVEHNFGVTPAKAVELWLEDHGYNSNQFRRHPDADLLRRVMREQLMGIAKKMRP
jgi:hypothetical protein